MAQHLTVMTRKGQITVPVAIRRALGLKEGDKVAVSLENGHARLVPCGSFTARTAGMFRVEGSPLTAEQLREAAARRMAEEAVSRGGQ